MSSIVKIAIQIEDRPLAIMNFLTEVRRFNGTDIYTENVEPTTENIEAEIRKAFGEVTVNWQIIDAANIPTDRTYRDAWVLSGNSIIVDSVKAQEIEMISLRKTRNELLAESDLYVLPDRWNTYTEEKKAEWTAYRQALRDLPETVIDVFNPVWPERPI